jgi:uncharacterized protein involved in exopolysaccharide biosynthesis
MVNSSTEILDSPNADVGMRELIEKLWLRRKWLLISVVVVSLLAVVVAFVTTPVYRATAVLVPATSDVNNLTGGLASALGQFGGLASLAGIDLGANGTETQEAIAVLKSREFTEAFIRDQNLMPKLFRKKWDAQQRRWREGVEPPTSAEGYKRFNKKIRSVIEEKKTGLVNVQIDWTDPQEAADWANELVRRLNAEMRSRAIAKSNASLGYLEDELKTTLEVATREAINRLIEAQIKQRMVANVTTDYAFRIVDRAMASDPDDPEKPKKIILIALGPIAGLAIGVVAVLLAGFFGPIVQSRSHA